MAQFRKRDASSYRRQLGDLSLHIIASGASD